MINLMHGINYDDVDPTGWWMTEKFDGVRALWDGARLWSRAGMEYTPDEAWLSRLPRGFAVDGELIVHGPDSLNATRKIVQAKAADWSTVSFVAFDAPGVDGPLEARWRALRDRANGTGVDAVAATRCAGRAHLHAFAARIIDRGGEGAVIREPGTLYMPGRDDVVQKVKARQLEALRAGIDERAA